VATAVMTRVWGLVALGVACAAVAGVGLCWVHSRRTVAIAPIADGQPSTTSLVYEPAMLLLTMLLAIVAGVLAVIGVTRLRRARDRRWI
jgi:hypothetical protein